MAKVWGVVSVEVRYMLIRMCPTYSALLLGLAGTSLCCPMLDGGGSADEG